MWMEGLFLTPQHLQLADEHHEAVIDQRLAAVNPHLWGLSVLEVDADELARGVFSLGGCQAVMPDGLVVRIGENQPIPALTKTASGALRGAERSLGVYLAVPAAGAGSASSGASAGTRYVETTRTLSDNYGVADDAQIQCVRPNAQILFERDNRQNYITLKLAEIQVNESGRMTLAQGYLPPMTRIGTSPALMQRLEQLVAALSTKQRDLAGKYGDRSAAMLEFGAADMATFWYLHTINSWLPVLMHYAASETTHPEQLYLALAAFAGQLSSFEATSDPLDLPRYRHDDPAETFWPLLDVVSRLLGTVLASRYSVIDLEETQAGLFVGRVDDPNVLKRALYLVVGGDLPEEALRDDVPRYLKVGSLEQIAQIVQSALPGVTARVDHSPPNAIPVRPHLLYLRLEQTGSYWEGVEHSATIAIYQPVKPNKVKLELLAVDV